MENTNPVAPTSAPAEASVASTSNSNDIPAAASTTAGSTSSQSAEPTPEQIAKYLGTTVEGLDKFKKFSDNNGGFDKIFAERKKEITTPQVAQAAPSQSAAQAPAAPAPAAPKIDGGMTMEDIMAKTYFNSLADENQYANISAEIKDGTIFDKMKELGVQPVINGIYDDKKIRAFLGMYSSSKPAVPASAPTTSTPTVSPAPADFNGPITDSSTALKIIQENQRMVAAGRGQHPRYDDAKKFLSSGFAKRNPGRKEFTPWKGKDSK